MTAKRLMVIVAHPDDESFSIGGTIAKVVAEAGEVILVTATRGEAGIPDMKPDAAGQLRERELRAACEALGVKTLRFLGYRDGTLDQVDSHNAIEQLIALMRAFRPDAIITFGPDGISGHPDHVTVHQWTTAAFERARRAAWARRLYYITPSAATAQGCGVLPSSKRVGGAVAFVDVGGHLVTKVRAMQCHASQQPPFAGDPEQVASQLVCHEVFTRIWPTKGADSEETVFEPVTPQRRQPLSTPVFVVAN
jgi:LmbE family N-acetylglucosaminyl deacetylase